MAPSIPNALLLSNALSHMLERLSFFPTSLYASSLVSSHYNHNLHSFTVTCDSSLLPSFPPSLIPLLTSCSAHDSRDMHPYSASAFRTRRKSLNKRIKGSVLGRVSSKPSAKVSLPAGHSKTEPCLMPHADTCSSRPPSLSWTGSSLRSRTWPASAATCPTR